LPDEFEIYSKLLLDGGSIYIGIHNILIELTEFRNETYLADMMIKQVLLRSLIRRSIGDLIPLDCCEFNREAIFDAEDRNSAKLLFRFVFHA